MRVNYTKSVNSSLTAFSVGNMLLIKFGDKWHILTNPDNAPPGVEETFVEVGENPTLNEIFDAIKEHEKL